MTVLLEPVCHSWMHEEVNSAFLKLVQDSCQDEIIYIGEKEHIKCISKIVSNNKNNYKQIKNYKLGDKWDDYNLTTYYFKIIRSVMHAYKPKRLFILCAYCPGILAAEMAAYMDKRCKIYVVLHGMIEKNKGKMDSYKKLFQWSKIISNISFISYSPFCTADYWDIMKEKMIFIHHPYIEIKKKINNTCNSGKIIIGIIGACANDKALHLIKCINQMRIKNDYEFWVLSRFGKKFNKLSHTKVLDLIFDKKSKEKIISKMNYILLPYGRNEYTVSASGVLWDAISNKIPCFMLDSKYFTYYQAYHIGYQSTTIPELAEIIKQKIEDNDNNREDFFKRLEKLKDENQKVMKILLN